MYSFEVQDSDETDGREGSRSRTAFPEYHNHNEARSSSVPPSLLQQHQPNGQGRIGSPVAFRGRPPPPNVRGPWPPRSLSPRYYRPPPGDLNSLQAVASIIKFTTSYLCSRTELSRYPWMLSTDTSFHMYDGVNFTIQAADLAAILRVSYK